MPPLLLMMAIAINLLAAMWLALVGLGMFFQPERMRTLLSRAGSTPLINYGELGLRCLWGAAMYLIAEYTTFATTFSIMGGFIVLSSIALMLIPRQWHAAYSQRCAQQLSHRSIRLLSPITLVFAYGLAVAVWPASHSLVW